MPKLSSFHRTWVLRVGAIVVLAGLLGYAVVQIYDEAYLEGSRVGVSSELLQQASVDTVGKSREELSAADRARLDAALERALKVATDSEFALSWLQVFAPPSAAADFSVRVQRARCAAARSQSIWMWLHELGVRAAFTGPSKFELPPC